MRTAKWCMNTLVDIFSCLWDRQTKTKLLTRIYFINWQEGGHKVLARKFVILWSAIVCLNVWDTFTADNVYVGLKWKTRTSGAQTLYTIGLWFCNLPSFISIIQASQQLVFITCISGLPPLLSLSSTSSNHLFILFYVFSWCFRNLFLPFLRHHARVVCVHYVCMKKVI